MSVSDDGSMDVTISEEPLTAPVWNELVASSPTATVYHRPELVRLAAALPDHVPLGLIARRDGVALGGIAVVTDTYHQVFPRSIAVFNGPMVVAGSDEPDRLARMLMRDLARRHHRTHLRLAPFDVDIRPLVADGWSTSIGFSWHVDLTDIDLAWRRIDENRRRLIRRAERRGHRGERLTKLDASTIDRLAHLHSIQQSTNGNRVDLSPEGWHGVLPDLVADGVVTVHVTRSASGQVGTVVVVAPHFHTAAIVLTGADPATLDDGAAALVRWHVMQTLAEQGSRCLDLNGARPGPSGRFKASFGGTLVERWGLVAPERRRWLRRWRR